MTAFTDYTEGQVGAHIFRTASFTKPTGIFVGLMSAVTNGETSTVTELTGGSYARVAVGAPSDATWTGPTGGNGTFANAAVITFPTATADWVSATHFGIWDAVTAGNLLVYSPLTAARTVTNGSTASFGIGTLTVQVDN